MRIFLILTLFSVALSATAQDKLTLDDIISIALDNNYSIKIVRNDLRVANNNHTLGNAGFLPTVDALANRGYTNEDTEQVFADGSEQNRDNAKGNSLSWGGELNWTIFDGGQMFFNYDRLEALQLRTEAELQFAVESLIFNVQTAFYQAALQKERLSLFNSNLEFSEERLRISKDRYELGQASKLEFLQAQVDYNADKSAILSQLELLAAQKYQLVNLMGIDKDTLDFEISYDLLVSEGLDIAVLLQNLEHQNQRLISLRRNIDVVTYDKKVLRGQYFPELDVYVGYNSIDNVSGAGFLASRYSNQITYGLTARWNIFNGFNLQRQIQNADIAMENSVLQLDQQKLEYSIDIKTTYLNYTNNLALMALEEENLEVARENNDIAQERYRIGMSNSLELREAQVNFVNAEIRYQNAAFAAKLAEIELLFLAGSIVNTTN